MEKDIILFVQNVPPDVVESIASYRKVTKEKLRIAVIKDVWKKSNKELNKQSGIDIEILCDLNDPEKIAKALLLYQDKLRAITCRGEAYIESFTKIIPNVPYLKTPTSESLLWCSDKIRMRKRFMAYDKSITPRFFVTGDVKKKTIKEIKQKVGFPLIIKPSGLAASLLVSICFHEEELESMLKKTFRKIKKVYEDKGRKTHPAILVEQFMEGEMYSVDTYITARGKIYFCPMVHIKTGRSIGLDDFFGYQQMTPTTLRKSTVDKAELVASKAIKALGLRSSTAHVELMRTDNGWKVIEVGARIGGFRQALYKASYGIDHGMNDILVRIPQKPVVSKRTKGYSAAMKFYPKKEGILTQLKGIKKIQELKSVKNVIVHKKIGDRCLFAKHGGASVCSVILFNKERTTLLADIRRIEKGLLINTK